MPEQNHQIFNDDLLSNEGDYELAKERWPAVIGALHFPNLIGKFREYDDGANRYKRSSNRAGIWAVALGTLALLAASSEPAIHPSTPGHEEPLEGSEAAAQGPDGRDEHLAGLGDENTTAGEVDRGSASAWLRFVGLIAACFGIASVCIAVRGGVRSGTKREWMRNRLCTERLRQLCFQILVARLPSILASLEGGVLSEKARAEREGWLSEFVLVHERQQDGLLDQALKRPRTFRAWQINAEPLDPATDPGEPHTRQLLDAYDTLRFKHQINLAHKRLAGLRIRKTALKVVGLSLIGIIVLIHAALAGSLLFPDAPNIGSVASNPATHLAIIWCAVLALAVRALEDGLAVREELKRYEEYADEAKHVQERFYCADTLHAKREAMMEMEQVTVGEMTEFFRGIDHATFLI